MAAQRIDAVGEAARARLGARAHDAPAPEPERLAALGDEVRRGAYSVPAEIVAEAVARAITRSRHGGERR